MLLKACEHSERLVRENPDVSYKAHRDPLQPDNRGFRFGLSSARRKLGLVYVQTGRTIEAEAAFGRAIETLAPCIDRPDARHEHVNYLAQAHFERGKLRYKQRDLARAGADFREAVRRAAAAVRSADADTCCGFPEHRRLLADCLDTLAAFYSASSRIAESSTAAAQARDCRGILAKRQRMAGIHSMAEHNFVKAESAFEESIELFLERDAATDRDFLAAAWHSLGKVHQHNGHPHLADRAFENEPNLRK
jgi:tetratricopeptide (TPR) repeat protein